MDLNFSGLANSFWSHQVALWQLVLTAVATVRPQQPPSSGRGVHSFFPSSQCSTHLLFAWQGVEGGGWRAGGEGGAGVASDFWDLTSKTFLELIYLFILEKSVLCLEAERQAGL